jgi:amino acid transporter
MRKAICTTTIFLGMIGVLVGSFVWIPVAGGPPVIVYLVAGVVVLMISVDLAALASEICDNLYAWWRR